MSAVTVAAVDLGASSGRVMVGHVDGDRVDLIEAHRFTNTPVRVNETLYWDVLALYRGVLDGVRAAGRDGALDSIGIDTWAVDYGLLDGRGGLLGNPVHHRDERTDSVMETVLARVPAAELYDRTGVQFLPINTVYQLVAAADDPAVAIADQLLLMPDLLAYWLTGECGAEITNASTTQLLDVRSRTWATDLMERLDIRPELFPPLRGPGDAIGHLRQSVLESVGFADDVPVTAVGSHDTASAVVAVPTDTPNFAYISCGTWSLVGLELDAPVLTPASREANFTNELGVDGTVRYLRNVMGLWLLQESLRTWERAGGTSDLDALLRDAAESEPLRSVVDPDAAVFLPPGDMPARIAGVCERSGQPVPATPPQIVRCILDSLALAYRRAMRDAQRLADVEVDVMHVVGGGSRNALLCQLAADACGLPVVAGPVEATALGNVLVQARALGALAGGLDALRRVARGVERLGRYEPSSDPAIWEAAAARLPAR